MISSSSSSCSKLPPGALGFFLGTGFPEGGAFPPPPLLRCFAGAGGGGAGGVARGARAREARPRAGAGEGGAG